MRELVIAPPAKEGKEGKGRAFRAVHLAHLEADSLWEGGLTDTDAIRPVWLMVGGTEAEIRPFITNLQLGKKAEFVGRYRSENKRFELLRSAGYQYTWQRIVEKMPDGRVDAKAIVTAYLPDLFRGDLGMVDPKGVSFCLLPPNEWIAASSIDTAAAVSHVRKTYGKVGVPISDEELHRLVPIALLFCSFLDRRTRCPMVADTCFYLQLFCSALAQGVAGWTRDDVPNGWGRHARFRLNEVGIADVRLTAGYACHATHTELETLLTEQVKIYNEVRNGTA
jgi:hypothetical protein